MTPTLPDGLQAGGRFDRWDPLPPAYVVADIDGTLVGPPGHASPAVADAVRRVQAAGLRCGFATGRMRLAVEPLWRQLRAAGPHVVHNGAEVRADGRTVASWPLAPAQVRAVFDIHDELGTYAEIYVDGGYYVTDLREEARPHWDMLGHEPFGTGDDLDPDRTEVLKATFALFDGEPLEPVLEALAAAGLTAGPAGTPVTPHIRYVNATHAEADKGRALTAAAEHLGVPLRATVAIGDAPNDLTMFEVAGTAVAMGQADPEMHAAAHLVAPTVADDGAALVLATCIAWCEAATTS